MKTPYRDSCYLLLAFLFLANIGLAQSKRLKELDEKAVRVKHLIDRINKHPDSLEMLNLYILEVGIKDTSLQKNYKEWLQKYPTLVNIPFALGKAYGDREMPEASDYLLKAVGLDSSRADIWEQLAVATSISGDKLKAIEYYKKASLLKPNNADYAFYYAYSFKDLDPIQYKEKNFDVAMRFPGTMRGAQALYWLGRETRDTTTKIGIFERLYKEYRLKNEWAIDGALQLYYLYLQKSPEKAISMCEANHWPPKKIQAEQIIDINNLIAQKNYQQALTMVDSVQHLKNLYSWYYLTYKKAELYNLTGNPRAAYDILLVEMVKTPTYKLRDLLLTYGAKIGKTENDLNADIWKCLDKTAVMAPVFSSKMFTEDKRVSLRDYRGKVVLLTFWFPACSPCRAEFPHFEKVMKKIDRQQVAYLGVNGFPEQDGNVLKVMENDKLTFTPLHGSQFVVQNLYNFDGYPSNYLIDQQGRIIFSHFQINDDNEDTLELMINEILDKDKNAPASLMADTMKH